MNELIGIIEQKKAMISRHTKRVLYAISPCRIPRIQLRGIPF
jgi:hypothetical protein